MTLRTITFDDSIYKLVPLEPDHIMVKAALCGRIMPQCCEAIARIHQQMKSDLAVAIAAAPEYQDKIADLESQDFYEVMQAYRHDKSTGSDTFEAVKQWLRNPVYEYQDTKKDE